MALTDSANPEIKQMIRIQLDDAIELHQRITTYMNDKGFYHPADVAEQINLDMSNANTVLNNTK
jgi:similar to spore coat protein